MRAYHTLVVGDSGGGKTTLLREMHDGFHGYSIWIDDSKRGESKISGRHLSEAATVSTPRELAKAGARKIRYRTSSSARALRAAVDTAREVHDRSGWGTQIVFDEAQTELAEHQPKDHPIIEALHEGRDEGIKMVLATQDPSDMQPNYSAIKQCRWYIWVGGWSTFHDGFIRYFKIDRDRLPTDRFEYVVMNKRMEVVSKGETNPDYA